MMETKYFNQKLEESLKGSIGEGYCSKIGARVTNAVHHSIREGLRVENDEVLPKAGLISKLGAESIDGLDVSFRIEQELGCKLKKHQCFLVPEEDEGKELTVLGVAKRAYEALIKETK